MHAKATTYVPPVPRDNTRGWTIRPWKFQFSLRAFFLGLTVACIATGGLVAWFDDPIARKNERDRQLALKLAEKHREVFARVTGCGGSVTLRGHDVRVDFPCSYGEERCGNRSVDPRPPTYVKLLPKPNYVNTPKRFVDADLAALAEISTLVGLSLHETDVTDKGLAHLDGHKQLAYLGLRRRPITDDGLAALGALPKLEYLDCDHTKATYNGVARLRENCPNLGHVFVRE
jgi:hypothetical protein